MQQQGKVDSFQIIVGSQSGFGGNEDVGVVLHNLYHVVGKETQGGV